MRTTTTTIRFPPLSSQKNIPEDDNDEEYSKFGMDRAFQQLERLSFLANDTTETNTTNVSTTTLKLIRPDTASNVSLSSPTTTPEQELELYKNMVQELELSTEEDLYATVLQDMGGTPLNETTTTTKSAPRTPASIHFLNQALEEALQQVQVNHQHDSAVDSILNDPIMLNEIEAIFDRGNAQLLQGLEDIRREQELLTQASILRQQQQQQQSAAASTNETQAQRLQDAERSIQHGLNRVHQERTNVEQAVDDLQRAQTKPDNSLVKLKQNPLQQVALIGFVLFAVRSLMDSFVALSSNDPSQWTVALVQGAIAILCAAAFYLVQK